MSKSRTNDQESRRQIREELLTNILVEAGAGSGKTQMLAERMAAGVAEGVYHVEHMAAVTFTRKAASELRGRFHLALESELAKARGRSLPGRHSDPERVARVSSALSNLERFFAGTIHSFCARLLRERPVESGVSPGFTELDEVQDLELRQRAWRDFITSARAAGDPDMMALLETDVRAQDLDAAFATVCLNDDVEFPPGEAERSDPKPAVKALDKFWKELRKHLPAHVDPKTTCKIQQAAVEFEGQLRVTRYRLDRPSVVASLLDTWDIESKIIQKFWADSAAEKKRLRDLIQGLHEQFHSAVVEPYLAQWRQYVYRLSVTLLTRARDAAAAERRRLNSLNYRDLLNLTARVLRENEPVRRALQQKFRHILVDEFQDTDPVQAEIVFWLAEDGTAGSAITRERAADWRKVPLRPGALFVVGDPKQSIYRFRRADIDIYNIVRDRFSDPAVGRVVPLTMNFRSVRQLCTWANEVFQTRFPAEPTAHAPRFAALDASDSNTGSGGVLTMTHNCERKEIQAQDAEKIATYIRSEVDARRRRFSDFLILTRKKRDRIAPYARALESLNIPIEVSGAGAFGGSPEVETLTLLLRALADPQDAVSLIAVLRGPLFGISDPELFAFRQTGGWFSIFYEPAATAPLSRAQSALAALRQYYRWTRILPAAAALDRILEDSGYLALAATTAGGADAGDVMHAVDRVRQVVEEGGSLAGAADALESDSDAANEVESLPLEPGRTDVVRVMNLHKAKGLEANVVFLADPTGGFPLRVDDHIERKGLEAQGWFKLVKKVEGKSWGGRLLGQHADWPDHELAEQPYRAAEEDRLLYVAATRARELLVVSRWTGIEKDEAWGVLNNFFGSADELKVPSSAPVQSVEPLDCSSEAQALSSAARIAAHDSVREASWAITSVTAEARHIARMTRTADAAVDDPTRVVGTDTPAHRADAGMAWGTLIHGLLEHAMRHKSATREDLRRLAMWLTMEEPQLRTVIEEALDTVAAVARMECWKEASEASEIHVEVPFVITDAESGPPLSLVSGVIDLAYKNGEWHVIDYKTDRDAERSDDQYAGQLSRYQAAWSTVTRAGTVQTQLVKARIA
jgi:ATP-dependent helicase/nuclease subunit A